MGNVIILQETVEKPITLMGQRAGICWEFGYIECGEKL